VYTHLDALANKDAPTIATSLERVVRKVAEPAGDAVREALLASEGGHLGILFLYARTDWGWTPYQWQGSATFMGGYPEQALAPQAEVLAFRCHLRKSPGEPNVRLVH